MRSKFEKGWLPGSRPTADGFSSECPEPFSTHQLSPLASLSLGSNPLSDAAAKKRLNLAVA